MYRILNEDELSNEIDKVNDSENDLKDNSQSNDNELSNEIDKVDDSEKDDKMMDSSNDDNEDNAVENSDEEDNNDIQENPEDSNDVNDNLDNPEENPEDLSDSNNEEDSQEKMEESKKRLIYYNNLLDMLDIIEKIEFKMSTFESNIFVDNDDNDLLQTQELNYINTNIKKLKMNIKNVITYKIENDDIENIKKIFNLFKQKINLLVDSIKQLINIKK